MAVDTASELLRSLSQLKVRLMNARPLELSLPRRVSITVSGSEAASAVVD